MYDTEVTIKILQLSVITGKSPFNQPLSRSGLFTNIYILRPNPAKSYGGKYENLGFQADRQQFMNWETLEICSGNRLTD